MWLVVAAPTLHPTFTPQPDSRAAQEEVSDTP